MQLRPQASKLVLLLTNGTWKATFHRLATVNYHTTSAAGSGILITVGYKTLEFHIFLLNQPWVI